MTPFTDDELIAYVLGQPVARAEEITRAAAHDEELAAQIDIMRALSGRPETPAPVPPLTVSQRTGRRISAAAAAVLLIGGLFWLARQPQVNALADEVHQTRSQLSEREREVDQLKEKLLEATDTGWFDSKMWLPPPDWIKAGGVKAEPGHCRLVNRGYLITRPDFPHPIELNLDWKWVQLGILPQYADFLTIVLRTSGEPERQSPYEIHDGVAIRFVAWAGTVSIWRLGENPARDVKTEHGKLPMPADAWHRIRVTDDGETIAVYVSGPAIKPDREAKPVLTARVPGKFAGRKIAISNRELTAGIPHESYVRKLSIRTLEKE